MGCVDRLENLIFDQITEKPTISTLGDSLWLRLNAASLQDDDIVTVYNDALKCVGVFTYPLRRFKSLGVEIGQSVDAEPEVIRTVKKALLTTVKDLVPGLVVRHGFIRLHDYDGIDWDYSVEVFYGLGEFICKMRDVDPSGGQRHYWKLR